MTVPFRLCVFGERGDRYRTVLLRGARHAPGRLLGQVKAREAWQTPDGPVDALRRGPSVDVDGHDRSSVPPACTDVSEHEPVGGLAFRLSGPHHPRCGSAPKTN
jgi:hypothetical protein